MDRRGFEGPMDWEYQNSGPFDPTSPFTHAAKNGSQNGFGTPSRASARPNPFANLGTPSKAQQPPPQSTFFTPQLQSRNSAPAFRNPAFTTPRRPFEDLALSEASGAEDSPALTETSDFPNDTPEADRLGDVTMGGTTTPSKIDKTFRYGKSGLSAKKHISGRGEIRGHREFSVTDLVRKRRKNNYDKDVSSISARYQGQAWDESDQDSDDSLAPRSRTRSRTNKKKKEEPRGFLGNLFHMLDQHPNAPDNLYNWVKFMINSTILATVGFVGWLIWDTVRTDIHNANESARSELMSKMTECQNQYLRNECSKNDRPALEGPCNEWFDCYMQNPDSIMRVRVTVKQIAEIINEFSDAMNLKAWGFFFAILLVCIFANNLTLGRSGGNRAPAPPAQSAPAFDPSGPPNSTPGYILLPYETPRRQRQAFIDEGTDTDSSPPKMRPLLEAAPYTPSRRSPSKGERSRSPVKPRQSPTKRFL